MSARAARLYADVNGAHLLRSLSNLLCSAFGDFSAYNDADLGKALDKVQLWSGQLWSDEISKGLRGFTRSRSTFHWKSSRRT